MNKHIKNRLTPPKQFFKWCENQIPIYKWKNNDKEIISTKRKGKLVVNKQLRSNSILCFENFYSFAIVLVTNSRIEIQSYAYYQDIIDGKEEIFSRLSNFEKFEDDNHYKFTFGHQGYVEGLTPNYSFVGGPYHGTKFYDNNWEQEITTISELKYIDLSEYKIERHHLSHLYRDRYKIEFLQKINSYQLANQVLCNEIDMRTLTKKYLRENKFDLIGFSGNFGMFELERRIKQRKGTLIPGIEKYLSYVDIQYIPNNIGIVRFQNWVIKNSINFELYKDYLSLLKDLNIDIKGERIIIPRDLQVTHDDLIVVFNEERKRREAEKLKTRFKARRKFKSLEINNLLFRVPNNRKEIIEEGAALNHCVGTSRYIDGHAQGKITLVFVRKKDSPDEPFQTMEIKKDKIVQIRGQKNKSAPGQVRKAAEAYLNIITKENQRRTHL